LPCGAQDREAVERFTREIAPLILSGPPSVTGFAGGRPRVQEIMAFWPALIDRREIEPDLRVEVTRRSELRVFGRGLRPRSCTGVLA
jgi:hypothetical protein